MKELRRRKEGRQKKRHAKREVKEADKVMGAREMTAGKLKRFSCWPNVKFP